MVLGFLTAENAERAESNGPHLLYDILSRRMVETSHNDILCDLRVLCGGSS